MKHLLFYLYFISFSLFSQSFSEIKEKTNTYPKLISAENLAKRIANDFSSKENQVEAAFYWLTHNIRYDLESLYNPKQKRIGFRYRDEAERLAKIKAIKDNIVKETLSSRKAVCEGFAQSLSKICNLLQIENEVIKGYVRNSSRDINNPLQSTNHAWNAVKLNNKWKYFDATWSAGAVTNGKWYRKFNPYYYNISTKNYFKTHYPESKLWQLRVGRMSLKEFYNQPIFDSEFLISELELVTPKTGIVNVINNTIVIKLKNVPQHQKIMCGFPGYQYATKPIVINSNIKNETLVSIKPPKNAKSLFLLLNGEVVLEFMIN